MAGRRPILRAALAGATALALLMAAGAEGAAATGGSGGQSASQGGAGPDAAARAADPAKLIDPDMYATAIEVSQTPHFGSITITPVDKSENSRALVRTVLEDQQGLEDLRSAVRGNSELMAALKGKGVPVGDVVSVTTDQNDNAIVFVKE